MGWIWDALTNVENYEFIIKKAFDYVDSDGSGEISSNEILSIIQSINSYYDTGIHPTPEQLSLAITACDEDKSGKISFKELMNLLKRLSKYQFGDDKAQTEQTSQQENSKPAA